MGRRHSWTTPEEAAACSIRHWLARPMAERIGAVEVLR